MKHERATPELAWPKRPPVSGCCVRTTPPGTENSRGPNILGSATRFPARVYPDPGRSTGRRLDVEDGTAGRWLDVNSAADELGVSTDAVRKRISRGTLRSDRKDGAVRVWLDDGGTEAGREAQVDGVALVEVLREQAEYLRGQLAEERETNDLQKLRRSIEASLKDGLKRAHVIFRGSSRALAPRAGQTCLPHVTRLSRRSGRATSTGCCRGCSA